VSRRSATQQRLDPLGTLAAWPLAPALGAVVLCYSVIATVLQVDQVQNPLLATLAVFAMAAAVATLLIASHASRPPFDLRMHLIMVGLATIGYLLETASRWGANELVQDDFGPIGIGLLLLALAPYRPWREIATSGAVISVLAVIVTLPQGDNYRIDVPVGVYAIVSVTQILAPAAAGAAYSRRIVRSILSYQTDARRAIVARTEEARGQLARAVVEQQVSALKSGVIPFLTELLERGSVTALDVAQAGQLAAEVRRSLVAEVDRSWLDTVVTRERTALAERGTTALLVVADPEHRASAFTADQRAATAALLGALCTAAGFDPHTLVVQITGTPQNRGPYSGIPHSGTASPAGTGRPGVARVASAQANTAKPGTYRPSAEPARAPLPAALSLATSPLAILTGTATPSQVDTITIQAAVDLPPRRVRALLRPYLGVLRVVYGSVRVTVRRPLLTIELDNVRSVVLDAEPTLAPATPATPIGVRAKRPPRQVR
jgi:hypothetical protein